MQFICFTYHSDHFVALNHFLKADDEMVKSPIVCCIHLQSSRILQVLILLVGNVRVIFDTIF